MDFKALDSNLDRFAYHSFSIFIARSIVFDICFFKFWIEVLLLLIKRLIVLSPCSVLFLILPDFNLSYDSTLTSIITLVETMFVSPARGINLC